MAFAESDRDSGSDAGSERRRWYPSSRRAAGGCEEALRADPGAPCPALAGEAAADVCVAGGGFAGLWTAYELTRARPALGVVLLEADVCGAGGSGANGGFSPPPGLQLSSLCSHARRGGRRGLGRRARRDGRRAGRVDRAARRPHRGASRGHPVRPGRGVAGGGPTRRRSGCCRSTATPTGCGAWTRPRRGASRTRRASWAAWSRPTSRVHPAGQAGARAAPRAAGAGRAHLRGHARDCAWRPAGRCASSRRPARSRPARWC